MVHLVELAADSESVTFLRFGRSGAAVVGASAGPAAPGADLTFPAALAQRLRKRAAGGAWITSGARAASAYLPVVHRGRPVGLIVITGTPSDDSVPDRWRLRLPGLLDIAELAGSLLGPRFADLDITDAAAHRLDQILATKAFHPVFQPVWHLASERVVGVEALTRFDALPPDVVFAEARQLGRLRELELATLTAALAAAELLPPDRWLSVNASPALVTDTSGLRRLIGGSIRTIVLELSEHELVLDYPALTTSIKRLAPWVALAIDDAGAGFSSLRHILETSPSWVKLDISLVRGIDADLTRQALVGGLVHFARQAAISLVAEGIETPAELGMIRSLGVEYGQGFLMARPQPADEAARA